MKRLDGLLYRVGICRCRECKTLNTEDGVGGQCIQCGKIHGWVSRQDLIEFSKKVQFTFESQGTP